MYLFRRVIGESSRLDKRDCRWMHLRLAYRSSVIYSRCWGVTLPSERAEKQGISTSSSKHDDGREQDPILSSLTAGSWKSQTRQRLGEKLRCVLALAATSDGP